MLKRTTDTMKADGTCLQGYIRSSKKELTEAFGEPEWSGDYASKVQFEWVLVDSNSGKIVTIYDWKVYGEIDPDRVMEWNIGGHDGSAQVLAGLALSQHRLRKSQPSAKR